MMSTLLTLFCRKVDFALSPEACIPTRSLYLSHTYSDKNGYQMMDSDII
jgi:hypothetical protein